MKRFTFTFTSQTEMLSNVSYHIISCDVISYHCMISVIYKQVHIYIYISGKDIITCIISLPLLYGIPFSNIPFYLHLYHHNNFAGI